MSLKKTRLPVLLLTFLVSTLLLGWVLSKRGSAARSSPRTTDEVIAIARKLGLHHRSDQVNGDHTFRRLVISEFPITWARANDFSLWRAQSDWTGMVAVVWDWDGMRTMPDERMQPWGEFLVYGDPALIERLTAP